MASTATTTIYNGSPGIISGSTPFGFYDLDTVFQSDGPKVANYCARKLGYPIMEVELQDINFYACFEEAVSVYSEELYHSKIIDNYLSLEGASTGSSLNNIVVVPSLNSIVTIADNYGSQVQVGGTITSYSASLSLSSSIQSYDLQSWAINKGLITSTDRLVVNNVFYQAKPAINQYYDPYMGGSVNYQGGADNFGWSGYSPGLNFVMFPVYFDLARIQQIEMSNYVRRSAFTFELTNNHLKIFPIPAQDDLVIWLTYSKKSDLSSIAGSSPYGSNASLITNPSNVPYTTITYKQINHPGKQWIYEYTLALASELLGLIRGKYNSIPAPGAELTLNSTDLITKGSAQQTALRDRLRMDFEMMSRKTQLERKQIENQSMTDTLNNVPSFIYIG